MRRAVATAAVLAALGVAGCGDDPQDRQSGGQPETTAQQERIAVAAGPEPRTLDAALATRRSERIIAAAIQTPLLTHPHRTGDEAAALLPALARSLPRLSDDRLEYRFALRPGLVYADGRLVKASDVERAIAHASSVAADPQLKAVFGGIVGAPSADGETLRGVRTDDRNGVVVVQLREPDGRLPLVLADPATAPIPELPSRDRQALPPSTGPLRVARVTADSVELVANPLRAQIESVPAARTAQVAVVGARSSASQLASGAVGVALANGPSQISAGTLPGTTAVTATSGAVWALMVPTAGLFASRPVREALAEAIDRRPLREAPGFRPACGLFPSWVAGAVQRDDCPPVPVTDGPGALLGTEVRLRVPESATTVPQTATGSRASSTTPPGEDGAGTTTVAPSTPRATSPTGGAAQPDTPLGVVAAAIESLGGTVAVRAGGAAPEQALEDGLADAALVRIDAPLPHPADYLAPARPLDTLVQREVERLQALPLTGSSGQWSALERRVLARAVVVPIASEAAAAAVGRAVEPRSVVLHPVRGLDLASLRLR